MSEKRRFHVVPQLLLVEDFAAVAALIAFFPLTNKTPSAVSSQYAQ